MTPNELLAKWGIRERLPETFGAGAWYDNTVRVVGEGDGAYLEWNDRDPVHLMRASKSTCDLRTGLTSHVVPIAVGGRAFALACKLHAVIDDYNDPPEPPTNAAPIAPVAADDAPADDGDSDAGDDTPPVDGDAVADNISEAIRTSAAPKRAGRKRGEVA